MWLSKERGRKTAGEPRAECGTVTVGDPTAVYLTGERRQVAVCSPGGYAWRPQVGEDVLVLKAGPEGEVPWVLGKRGEAEDLAPGQVQVGTKECGLRCGDGRVELRGQVMVGKWTLEDYILITLGLKDPDEEEEKEEEGTA